MIHIDTSGVVPTKRWNKKVAKYNASLKAFVTQKERNEYIDGHPYWGRFKNQLHKLSYGKCWYSEAREIYSHYHVDHFRPKKRALDTDDIDQGGYWWLAYDWKNYRLCGSVGNSKKSDYFPVKAHKINGPSELQDDEIIYFLDPIDPDDVKLLNFNEEGRAIPADPDENNWDFIRADITILWFDLNYPSLKTEREIVWKRTAQRISDVQKLMHKKNLSPSVNLTVQIKAEMEKFRKDIAPCSELSSTVRCCLRSTGLNWALRLLEEPINVNKYCREYRNSEE